MGGLRKLCKLLISGVDGVLANHSSAPLSAGAACAVCSIGVLERLALIAVGRAAGFSLDEIALMFAPDGRPRINRQMLLAKAAELDRTIRKLADMRDGLRHAAACRAPHGMSHLSSHRTGRRVWSLSDHERKKV